MINELKVKCFLCLCETLSFTECGKRLFISQQAVSRHIASLESDIGVKLFYRTRNTVELTLSGEKILDFFSETTDKYNSLLAEIIAEDSSKSKIIKVGYQNWLNLGHTPSAALSAIHKEIPELHIHGERHSPATLSSLLKNGSLDMILIHERFSIGLEDFQKQLLVETPMQIVVSRNDPLATEGQDYRVFKNHTFLIDAFENETHSDTIYRLHRELQCYDFLPKDIIVVPNRDSVFVEAEMGRGVFLSSSMSIALNSDLLMRFNTDVMEGLNCIWRDNGKNFVSKYANKLKAEYDLLKNQTIN